MFESAKFEHRLDKASFKTLEPALREDLLNAQFQLIDQKRRSLLVLIHGPDGSGKGAVLNRLYGWLDARKLRTLTYDAPTTNALTHPPAWKYWRDLPAYGEVGIMLGSWYQTALVDRALGKIGRSAFTATLEGVRRYEAMLEAEGVSILKLWLYLGADEAQARLKALEKGQYARPVVRQWTEVDTAKERERLWNAAEEVVRLTSTPAAPWHVVPAVDGEYRDAMAGTVLLDMLRAMDTAPAPDPAPRPPPANPAEVPHGLPQFSILSTLDLSKALDEKTYREDLSAAQHRITRLTTAPAFEKRGLVVVFEGE